MIAGRVVAVLAAAAFLLGVVACGDDDDALPGYEHVTSADGFDYDVTIPAGTQERIDDGADVRLVPGTWVVQVGETVRLVNNDDSNHQIGPFSLGPGETITQRFASEGVYGGWCSVHTSGQINLRVEATES